MNSRFCGVGVAGALLLAILAAVVVAGPVVVGAATAAVPTGRRRSRWPREAAGQCHGAAVEFRGGPGSDDPGGSLFSRDVKQLADDGLQCAVGSNRRSRLLRM